ncbi:MAG: SDR family oxidoreductase [Methylococcaceae bacterium]
MKTVLITGASRGLGKALARIFIDNKDGLILHSRETMIKPPPWITHEVIYGDLALGKTITRLANIAKRMDVDILINNAGIYLNKSFPDMTIAEFKEVIDINLLAPIELTKAIWPIFQKKKSGIVININSMAGKQGSNGESAYCASKHGLRGFSSSLQFDATKHNIRVIDVYPGGMRTDMTKDRANSEKLIDPCEVAQLIFKLCEDYPSMRITEIDLNRRIY